MSNPTKQPKASAPEKQPLREKQPRDKQPPRQKQLREKQPRDKQSARDKQPAAEKQAEPSEQQLASPIGPLMWLMIPLVLIILYGMLNHG